MNIDMGALHAIEVAMSSRWRRSAASLVAT